MPEDSTNWTQGELVRAVIGFGATLERIEDKLDSRPSWDDINRLRDAQKDIDTKQDEGLKRLEDRAANFLILGIGSLLSGLTSIVVAIATR